MTPSQRLGGLGWATTLPVLTAQRLCQVPWNENLFDPSLLQDLGRGLSLFGNSIVHTHVQLLGKGYILIFPLLPLLQFNFTQGRFLKFLRLHVLLSPFDYATPGKVATAFSPILNGGGSSCFHECSMDVPVSPTVSHGHTMVPFVPTAPPGSSVLQSYSRH